MKSFGTNNSKSFFGKGKKPDIKKKKSSASPSRHSQPGNTASPIIDNKPS
ncbi:MAG TPA: hypothetical protein PKD67_10520 [Ignavibacteriaceae bacterium]|nr:hypothetical protein [Ignavibacteriaceae bacterium]